MIKIDYYYKIKYKIDEFESQIGKKPTKILINDKLYLEIVDDINKTVWYPHYVRLFYEFEGIEIMVSCKFKDIEVVGDMETEIYRGRLNEGMLKLSR